MTSSRSILAACALLAACAQAQAPAPAPETASRPAAAASSEGDVCARPEVDSLVDVRALDPSIRADIRYATTNNFTGEILPGYEKPRAMLRPGPAAALVRVHRRLAADGLGLKIFDAYRPIRATQAMVRWAERSGNRWVLDQGYVARRSGHNVGATVDLTLVRLEDGAELDMGTPFDTFSEAAHPANATGRVLENRMRLARAMEAEGFGAYDKEWWHFRLPGDFAALDIPLRCYP